MGVSTEARRVDATGIGADPKLDRIGTPSSLKARPAKAGFYRFGARVSVIDHIKESNLGVCANLELPTISFGIAPEQICSCNQDDEPEIPEIHRHEMNI